MLNILLILVGFFCVKTTHQLPKHQTCDSRTTSYHLDEKISPTPVETHDLGLDMPGYPEATPAGK